LAQGLSFELTPVLHSKHIPTLHHGARTKEAFDAHVRTIALDA